MISIWRRSILAALLAAACTAPAAGAEQYGADGVARIDWRRFRAPERPDEDIQRGRQLLLNAARHNLAWAGPAADRIEKTWRELTGREAHDVIRPACEASCAMAVVLRAGAFDETAAGMTRQEALTRVVRLIGATAAAHNDAGWKYPWQSAFWAALLGQGGWMLWDDLPNETRDRLARIVQFEADRFLAPGYQVPYWNGRGGDTKAEENAWNSMIHHVACAMMPKHPHARGWKQIGSELMISAFAREADRRSNRVVDGRPMSQWLRGYNVREDGAAINHGILHPDYMACVVLQLRSHLVQSLAGQTVPQAADAGAEAVYRTFAATRWPSPPYKAPGGTIYVPGQAEVYYPDGTDWFRGRVAIYYVCDVYASVLGWGQDLAEPPSKWMRLRAQRLLQHQRRHPDGRVYAPGEFTSFPGREQMESWMLADAFLLQWLNACRTLQPTGNWLADPGP